MYPYSTAYIMFEKKLNAQFQPSRALDVTAVVEAYRNTPVRIVEAESVPFLPKPRTSTRAPPSSAPGTPRTATMSELR